MPLPKTGSQWPPADVAPMYEKINEWSAWYSGDPQRLIDAYAGQTVSSVTGGIPWWRFWSRARAGADGQQRAQLHVPLASDLAGVSAALLFGEAPRVRIRPEKEEVLEQLKPPPAPPSPFEVGEQGAETFVPPDEAAPADPAAEPDADPFAATPPVEDEGPVEPMHSDTEIRLLEILERGMFNSRLVEAAEASAAIGGVYIYPAWDKELLDVPFMAIAQADQAIGEFWHGFLRSVIFHRVLASDSNTEIWRHLELHEMVDGKAVVRHALYVGGLVNIGDQRPLDSHPDTAKLEAEVKLPLERLDVEYIPNIRPNRLFRSSPLGIADIQGSETLLDSLDEVYASWMRDVRLAKARIIVPRDYLSVDGDGNAAFDTDQEVYVPLDMEPGLGSDARSMLAHQFQIRYLEHRETANSFIDRIVSNAGYEPQTIGTPVGGETSGTALRIREHKTLLTLRRKSSWWGNALASLLEALLLIDNEIFDSGNDEVRPVVTPADSLIDDPLQLAQVVLALKTAESASIESRVRIVNPDWSEMEIMAEVKRIDDGIEAAKPPPVVSQGTMGNPDADLASTGERSNTEPGQGGNPNPLPGPLAK